MPEPIELRILDAFIDKARNVKKSKDPTWYNEVATVDYGPFVKDDEMRTPALFAEISFWRDIAQVTQNRHEGELDIRFTGYVRNVTDPVIATTRLFHDMKRVVAEAERLNDLVMMLWPIEAEIGTEKYQGSGRGTVVLIVRAMYRWLH